MLVHRLQEATPAQLSGRESPRTRQVGDPAMAERDQVLDRQGRALAVVRHHGEGAASLDRAIDQHHRPTGRHHLGHDLIVARGGRDHEAVDLAGHQHLDPLPLAVRIPVRRRHQRGVAGPVPHPFHAPNQRRKQGVCEVGDEHADRERLARLQRARDRVRRIAEPAGRAVDRRCGALVHQRAGQRVQRARHRSGVDARGFCNVAHGEGFLMHQRQSWRSSTSKAQIRSGSQIGRRLTWSSPLSIVTAIECRPIGRNHAE